jgi:glycosyltransferase involved in cell wall biosynthesis
MRVLIANANGAIVGGIETYLRALIPLLQSSGIKVGMLTEKAVDANDTFWKMTPVDAHWAVADDLPESVVRSIAAWRPDVVYHNGAASPQLDLALANAFPIVFFAHVYYGTCISGTKCQSAVPRPCHRKFGPACLAIYLPRRCGGRSPLTMLRHYSDHRNRLRMVEHARTVLVGSRHMRDEYIRNGIPADRIRVVPFFPPGLTPDATPPFPRPQTDRVLFVGRLTALKGWRELAEAIPLASAELGRTLKLIVAGDGPDRASFEAEAQRRGISAEFLGWAGSERRADEMRSADLLAVPSVWPEPFGLVGIEAGCVGLPAVGFEVGGIPDWLIPGVSGELAPGERPNAEDLAAAIVRALADESHLNKLRVGAWETAQSFTPEAHMELLIPILQAATA